VIFDQFNIPSGPVLGVHFSWNDTLVTYLGELGKPSGSVPFRQLLDPTEKMKITVYSKSRRQMSEQASDIQPRWTSGKRSHLTRRRPY
jgi:hypothetical protein